MVLTLLKGIPKLAKKGFLKNKDTTIKSVPPFTKLGGKTVDKVKSDAAKAKLKMVKDKLEQTFKKSDEVLNKLKTTAKKQKKILEE